MGSLFEEQSLNGSRRPKEIAANPLNVIHRETPDLSLIKSLSLRTLLNTPMYVIIHK